MDRYFDINESGYSIRCKLYCEEPRAVARAIVFCHGFGGHKDNRAAERFARHVLSKYRGTAVVTFDWPCHGTDARKRLTLADCSSYLATVVSHVRLRFATEDVCAYATSFGGYLVLKYIAETGNPFRKIALRCPAVRMYEAVTERIVSPEELEKLEKGKDVLVGFDRKIKIDRAFLEELKGADITRLSYLDYADDILILHGTKDEIIPIETVSAFADDNVIEFIPVKNADHRFTDPGIMDAAIARIAGFLEG